VSLFIILKVQFGLFTARSTTAVSHCMCVIPGTDIGGGGGGGGAGSFSSCLEFPRFARVIIVDGAVFCF
jgi:hypothetical protein